MQQRKQFTYYRSFHEAMERLKPGQRAELILAMGAFALDGVEPVDLTQTTQTIFAVIRPVLESGRAKARAALAEVDGDVCDKSKRKRKSKPKSKTKPKTETKGDAGRAPAPEGGEDALFERFWSCYPKKVGKQAARRAFGRVNVPVSVLLEAIARQRESGQWRSEGGRFVPNPATWLNQGRWEDELDGADRLRAAGETDKWQLTYDVDQTGA